jgi:hypothetical protein
MRWRGDRRSRSSRHTARVSTNAEVGRGPWRQNSRVIRKTPVPSPPWTGGGEYRRHMPKSYRSISVARNQKTHHRQPLRRPIGVHAVSNCCARWCVTPRSAPISRTGNPCSDAVRANSRAVLLASSDAFVAMALACRADRRSASRSSAWAATVNVAASLGPSASRSARTERAMLST